ncbi:MAG: helix-turn-helix domain-containing protein [Sphingomicrobium sp.]
MVDTDETNIASVGERLRVAREAKGLALEDVAAQTRIPRRHLESLEQSDWANLPAPTYTMGFAKSYASAIGLDRIEIGDQLRAEMGGARSTANDAEVYEAADPARTMPKWLVLGAVVALVVLVVGMAWYSRQSLEGPDEEAVAAPADDQQAPAAQPPVAASPVPAPAQGPVALTASEPVWVQIYEKSGKTIFQGELAAGQRFDVPSTSTAPLLKTGKPEALRITVGTANAPAVGPAATTVRDVSLLGPDLMRAPAAAPAQQPGANVQPR